METTPVTENDKYTNIGIMETLRPFADASAFVEVNGYLDRICGVWKSGRDGRALIRTYRYNHSLFCVDVLELAPGRLPCIKGHERAQ